MPYVNHRWLGGLLTNYQTMSARIKRLHDLERYQADGQLSLLPTRERLSAEADLLKLQANLGGVKNMTRVPDAMFVIDLKTEAIAVREAQRLRIPIIGLVDTNADPDGIDYVIPGNDDAIRACNIITQAIGDVVQQGRARFRSEEEAARAEAAAQQQREAEERARREEEEKAAAEAAERAEAEAALTRPARASRVTSPRRTSPRPSRPRRRRRAVPATPRPPLPSRPRPSPPWPPRGAPVRAAWSRSSPRTRSSTRRAPRRRSTRRRGRRGPRRAGASEGVQGEGQAEGRRA